MKVTGEMLKGKTALVTGAARRIGRAIALALAEKGVNVVIHHHTSSDDQAGEVAAEARRLGVQTWRVKGDLAEGASVEGIFSEALGLAGSIDYVVNNASVFPRSRFGEVTPQALSEALSVNAVAPLILSRAFAAGADAGAIVNLLDVRIRGYDPRHVAYQISKKVLKDLTEAMAIEYAPRIRVNAVAPGLILPPEGEDESYLERRGREILPGRPGRVEDVTEAVIFLLSQAYITGQVLFVDGGQRLEGGSHD